MTGNVICFMPRAERNPVMINTLCVENLRFDFGDSWKVYKTDTTEDLKKVKRCVDGTKDADIVALLRKDGKTKLYLIEVTDLRGAEIQNKEKLCNNKMVQEVAQKMRDTIPAIVSAFHTTGKQEWDPFVKKICDRHENIHVIFWMEQNVYLSSQKGFLSSFTRALERRLRWLTPRVFVESLATYQNRLPDLTVKNLPGAGQLP